MTVGALSPHSSADHASASCRRMCERCQPTRWPRLVSYPDVKMPNPELLPVTARRASEVMRPERDRDEAAAVAVGVTA